MHACVLVAVCINMCVKGWAQTQVSFIRASSVFFEMGFLTSLQPVNWLNWLFTSARTLGISSSRIISLCQQTIFHFLYGFQRSSSGPCTGKASTLPSEPYLLPYFITCLIYWFWLCLTSAVFFFFLTLQASDILGNSANLFWFPLEFLLMCFSFCMLLLFDPKR